jgi:hypothetical protein
VERVEKLQLAIAERRKLQGLAIDALTKISREEYKLSVESDWRYRQFFYYLQISPSYELARRYSLAIEAYKKGQPRGAKLAGDKKIKFPSPLPADFSTVLETYEAFGDVQTIDFWNWWVKRAQFQFGHSAEPEAHQLAFVPGAADITDPEIKQVSERLNDYLRVIRLGEGKPASLIVAIPMFGDRKKIMKRVGGLIAKAYDVKKMSRPSAAHYQMISDKSREDTIRQAHRVLRARIGLPQEKLFEIGKHSIRSIYANAGEGDYDHRRLLEQQTSDYLLTAYRIAENAARGRFPSSNPLKPDKNRPQFNYVELRAQYWAYEKLIERKLAAEKGPLSRLRQALSRLRRA